MDIKALSSMISELKSDGGLIDKFQKNPVAVIEEFLGVDLPDDQVNGLIAGIKSNLLGERDSSSQGDAIDFNSIIKSLSSNLDVNGDGKLGLDDLMGVASGFLKEGSSKDGNTSEENPLKSFKI